jgi:drug/metabolite transporter (DMT)-like permease
LIGGGMGGVALAEQWVSSSIAALTSATVSLWVALLMGLWERGPDKQEWLGLSLGFIGVALLSLDESLQINPLGLVILLLSSASWAFGSLWKRHLALPDQPITDAAEMLAGGAFLVAVGFFLDEPLPRSINLISLSALAYLVVFGGIVVYSAYMYLLRHVKPTLATSYAYVNPVVAVGLGVGLAGEQLSLGGLIAMLVILSGVGLVARSYKG